MEIPAKVVFYFNNWENSSNFSERTLVMPFGYLPSDSSTLMRRETIKTNRFYIYNFKNNTEDFLLIDSILNSKKSFYGKISDYEKDAEFQGFCTFFWNTESNLASYIVDINEGSRDAKYLGLFRLRMTKKNNKFWYKRNINTGYFEKDWLNLHDVKYYFNTTPETNLFETSAECFDFIVWKQAYEFLEQKKLNKVKGIYRFRNGTETLFEFKFIDNSMYTIKVF